MIRRYIIIFAICLATPATAQYHAPLEAKSRVTILVDLSGTWFNKSSKEADRQELEAVADTIAALAPYLKPPIDVRYLQIGDASLSRAPLCEARYMPNIFRTTDNQNEFADLGKMLQFFRDDCAQIVLMHTPQPFTDITGAFNTVSRLMANDSAAFNAVIALSDFKEERRRNQTGTLGSLRGAHVILLYRVLNSDRINSGALDERIGTWLHNLQAAGASASALDDISIEPAKLKRLLTQ